MIILSKISKIYIRKINLIELSINIPVHYKIIYNLFKRKRRRKEICKIVQGTETRMKFHKVCKSVFHYFSRSFSQKYKVEVKESPQGMQPPTQNIVKKPQHQPSRLRKFVAKNSAGLRIRAHPSLQSEQIGVVLVNDTIAFIDEVCDSASFAQFQFSRTRYYVGFY